jgi:adenosylmethionine-8-amino-7-oxononanoate aminotransferase
MNSKLLFPYAVNSSQSLRVITEYTNYGFIDNGSSKMDLSLGSCGCFPIGFKRKDIIDTVAERMKDAPFSSGEFYTTHPAVIELGDRLYNMSDGYRSFFSVSGSDAIEGAIKIAQLYNGRNKFLGFSKSYHGSTYMSSSVSDATYITNTFGKDPRCVISDYNLDSITDDLSAVVIETSSWQNGLYDPGKDFWQGLRQACTDKNIVLIVDDIAMCGGKTGSFFGWKDIVQPDVFTMGKALSGGYFPLSATCISQTVFDKIKDTMWAHGFSYSFNLSGIYSTLAYLDLLEKDNLLDNVPQLINWTKELADRLIDKGLIKDYNNHGLVFNLVLLGNKPLEAVFESFLYKHGLYAGLWNEGGDGLLFVVPITAPPSWFIRLESCLINALTDYTTTFALSS